MTVRLVPSAAPARPPREQLFQFLLGHDRWLCELVDHGPYGIEAQFWKNEEFTYSRRFDRSATDAALARELAIQWASGERVALEHDGEAR